MKRKKLPKFLLKKDNIENFFDEQIKLISFVTYIFGYLVAAKR